MIKETVFSLFLSYPLGIATNLTTDKIKEVIALAKMDDINPLKELFVKSFFKAFEEHNKHYDELSEKVINKIKREIKRNKEKLFDAFLINLDTDVQILSEMKKEDYRMLVARNIFEVFSLDNNDISESIMLSIISDCLLFYKASYLKSMSEKEGIISILSLNLKNQEDIMEIKEILNNFQCNQSFIEKMCDYKNAIKNKYSEVNFFGLGIDSHKQKKKCKLENIFVEPNLISLNDNIFDRGNENSIISFKRVKDSIYNSNMVILGDPGAGKSSIIKYIMLLMATNKIIINKNGDEYIPFRIELRKYLKHKKSNSCSIIGYLKELLQSEYQLEIQKSNLEQLFNSYNTLVFFDGLDEIFDLEDKINVRDDINNFSSYYSKCSIIVTSRIIGYDDAKFDENKFIVYKICDFDEDQIESCIFNWYRQDYNNQKIPDKIQKDMNELLIESRTLETKIRSNPLLLSLVIILYQNNGQLPSSKLELYKSCTNTLVENWDKAKSDMDILLPENLIRRKENIFSSLALWQYKETSKKWDNINLTNKNIQNHIKETIISLQLTEDIFEADKWSREFLDYAEKRSIYFDNTFTHKTFWEYYTALRLYKENYRNTQKMIDIFYTYLSNSFWSNVLELLFYMIDEFQCDNKELDEITMNIAQNESYLPNINRVLPYLKNISINQIKYLIKKSLEICTVKYDYDTITKSKKVKRHDNFQSHDLEGLPFDIFKSMVFLYNNNYIQVFKYAIEEVINEYKSNKIILNIYVFFDELGRMNHINRYKKEETGGLKKELLSFIMQFQDIEKISKSYPYSYSIFKYNTNVRNSNIYDFSELMIEYYELFGLAKLCEDYPSFYTSNMWRTSIVEIYVNIIVNSNIKDVITCVSRLLDRGIDFSVEYIDHYFISNSILCLDDIIDALLEISLLKNEFYIRKIIEIYEPIIKDLMRKEDNALELEKLVKSGELHDIIVNKINKIKKALKDKRIDDKAS